MPSRVAQCLLLALAGGLAGGCGTKTVTVTKTVTKTNVSTVVEHVASRNAVFFRALNGGLVYKPSVIAMSDTFAFTNVHWRTYGKAIARARGSYTISDCEPTCASATRDHAQATIELSRPKPCRGFRAYTRIRIDGVGMKYDARPYPLGHVIKGTPPC